MTVQSDVYVIILLTLIIGIGIILISKKLDSTDPLEKPKGIIVPVILGVQTVYNAVRSNVGTKTADRLTPYILVLWIYIFLSNIVSLFGLSSPTANLSVTLLLAFITWVLIQITELKYGGFGAYLHSFIEPLPVMLPMNIIGKFSTMCSMALRLFGNITCGGIMMQLISDIAAKYEVPCQVSLEKRMACGLGACLSCAVDTKDGQRKKVCKDGPVFWAEEVQI